MTGKENPLIPPAEDNEGRAFRDNFFTFNAPDDDEDAPEELQDLFSEHGLGKRAYRCILKENSGHSKNAAVIKQFSGCYPSLDWLKYNCGPGDYKLVFTWRARNREDDNRVKQNYRDIDITIDERCRDEYEEFQFEERLKRAKRRREKINKAHLDREFDVRIGDISSGGNTAYTSPEDIQKAAREYIRDIKEAAKDLGFAQSKGIPSIEWDKILPIAATALPALAKLFIDAGNRRYEEQKNMMLMLTNQSNSSTSQMLELMKAQAGPTSGKEMVQEMFGMLKGAVDMKEMLEGKKESVADKVFGMVENVLPALLQVMAMPRPKQLSDPRVKAAQAFVNSSEDVQSLKNNPFELKKFVDNMDDKLGWEQTDQVLMIMSNGEISRPESCPRLSEKRYPMGHPERESHINEQGEDYDNDPDGSGEDAQETGL